MLVRLRVGPDGQAIAAAQQFGHQLPRSEIIIGLVDTGCTGLEIREPTLLKLGAQLTGQQDTLNASGTILAKSVYSASVELLGINDVSLVSLPTAEVRALPATFRAYEALVGWPLLRSVRLLIDGPTHLFTIEANPQRATGSE